MSETGYQALEGVDSGLLAEVHISFSGKLFDALGQNPRWTEQTPLAEDVPGIKSSTHRVKLASSTRGVSKFKDERIYDKIVHYDQDLDIDRWQNAIDLDLDNLDDEVANLGLWNPTIRSMADDFDEHPHLLQMQLVSAGLGTTLGTAFDNVAFFSASHPLPDGTTQSNTGDLAFTGPNLYTAIQAMRKMKKPNGKLANVVPTHGLFPEALRATVEPVIQREFVSDGTTTVSNTLKNRIIPIFDPRLDAISATAWFLFDLSKADKPLFKGTRRGVTPRMKVDDFNRRGAWGADARYGFSYGMYHLAWGTDGVP